jgi:hypothetical protein
VIKSYLLSLRNKLLLQPCCSVSIIPLKTLVCQYSLTKALCQYRQPKALLLALQLLPLLNPSLNLQAKLSQNGITALPA